MQGQYFPLLPGSHIKYLGGAGLQEAQLTGAKNSYAKIEKFMGAKKNSEKLANFMGA